jgi:hypothetical protein
MCFPGMLALHVSFKINLKKIGWLFGYLKTIPIFAIPTKKQRLLEGKVLKDKRK